GGTAPRVHRKERAGGGEPGRLTTGPGGDQVWAAHAGHLSSVLQLGPVPGAGLAQGAIVDLELLPDRTTVLLPIDLVPEVIQYGSAIGRIDPVEVDLPVDHVIDER